MTLPKKNRMTQRDFSKRFKSGKRLRGARCSVQYGPMDAPESKIAIVIQSKAASGAVERNRIRRTLSEHMSLLLERFVKPVFVVIIVHQPLSPDELSVCRQDITEMLQKSGIIN